MQWRLPNPPSSLFSYNGEGSLELRVTVAPMQAKDSVNPLWVVRVSPVVYIRWCAEYQCPPDRGSCFVNTWDMPISGGFITTNCRCHYGWGGEACQDRVFGHLSLGLAAAALLGSCFAAVPTVSANISRLHLFRLLIFSLVYLRPRLCFRGGLVPRHPFQG